MALKKQLKQHEGRVLNSRKRHVAYKDSLGILTIAYGRNIEERGLSEEEAEYLLDNDIRDITDEIIKAKPVFYRLSAARQEVLINMGFMGVPKLLGFKRMWAALEKGDYALAAVEILDSKWARIVKGRADDLYNQMVRG